MKIRISPTHLISHSAGEGVRSIGKAPSTASASLVARSSASAPPTAIRLVEAKNAVPFCSDAHDLHVDHAGLAVEHAPDPDLAVDIHAGRQAVASVGGVLQRDGIHRPFQDEEADRQNIDPIAAMSHPP